MTWAGKQSEQPRSFQSPEKYLLLTFPFIERASSQRGIAGGKPTSRDEYAPWNPDTFRFADTSPRFSIWFSRARFWTAREEIKGPSGLND
jgi:hypothetical protein